jgi:hypothetical protein
MPRPPSTVGQIACPIGPRERICCDDLKSALGLATDANLLRTALYHYAVFVLGAGHVETALFRLPTAPARRRRRLPRTAA